MAAASGGAKAKLGTWEDVSANDGGIAGYFRLYATDGVTVHAQGTVTATAEGGDMTVNNVVIAITQPFTVTGFTITCGNA
jgi:hypothetical protein